MFKKYIFILFSFFAFFNLSSFDWDKCLKLGRELKKELFEKLIIADCGMSLTNSNYNSDGYVFSVLYRVMNDDDLGFRIATFIANCFKFSDHFYKNIYTAENHKFLFDRMVKTNGTPWFRSDELKKKSSKNFVWRPTELRNDRLICDACNANKHVSGYDECENIQFYHFKGCAFAPSQLQFNEASIIDKLNFLIFHKFYKIGFPQDVNKPAAKKFLDESLNINMPSEILKVVDDYLSTFSIDQSIILYKNFRDVMGILPCINLIDIAIKTNNFEIYWKARNLE